MLRVEIFVNQRKIGEIDIVNRGLIFPHDKRYRNFCKYDTTFKTLETGKTFSENHLPCGVRRAEIKDMMFNRNRGAIALIKEVTSLMLED